MANPSTSFGRRISQPRRQSRRTRNASLVVNVEEYNAEAQSPTCIDLTADVSTYDVIDLTSGQNISLMDSPVVVLSPTDDVGPMRRRRGSGRRGRHRSGTRRRLSSTSLDTQSHSRTQPYVHVLLSEDSDSDGVTESPLSGTTGGSDSVLKSPEGVKISCPVCMDDPKQIQRNGRQVVSTTCGHIFCDVCIKAAINTQHACPTCRKKLYQRSIHPLFL